MYSRFYPNVIRQTRTEAEAYERLQQEKKQQKRQMRENDCRAIVDDVIEVALLVSDHRSMTEGEPLPAKEWEDMMRLFVSGLSNARAVNCLSWGFHFCPKLSVHMR